MAGLRGRLIFPGSFNPCHDGHLAMAEAGERCTGQWGRARTAPGGRGLKARPARDACRVRAGGAECGQGGAGRCGGRGAARAVPEGRRARGGGAAPAAPVVRDPEPRCAGAADPGAAHHWQGGALSRQRLPGGVRYGRARAGPKVRPGSRPATAAGLIHAARARYYGGGGGLEVALDALRSAGASFVVAGRVADPKQGLGPFRTLADLTVPRGYEGAALRATRARVSNGSGGCRFVCRARRVPSAWPGGAGRQPRR